MRSQLKRAYIDVDFLNQPKVRGLAKAFGRIAQLALIDVYLAMSKATNAAIDKFALLAVFEEYGLDGEALIAYCLEAKMIQPEGKGYSNSVVIKDQEQYAKKLKKKTGDEDESAEDSAKDSGKNFPEKKKEIPISDTDYDYENDSLKKNRAAYLTLAGPFKTPDLEQLVGAWARRTAKQGRPLDQGQLDALCMRFSSPKLLKDALIHTLSLSKALNVVPAPTVQHVTTSRKAVETPTRRNLNTFTPPTEDQSRPRSEAEVARNKKLLEELNLKTKGVGV